MREDRREGVSRLTGKRRIGRLSAFRAIFTTLEEIAQRKNVSFAWVVRKVAEKYIAEKWPLLTIEGRSS